MRLISFFLTTDQFLDGSKDVTRRNGWKFLVGKTGVRLMAIEKGQGLKKGEKVNRLGEIEVLDARLEPLWHIIKNPADCRREGFPKLSPREFIKMYCKHNGCHADEEITRMVFRRDCGMIRSAIFSEDRVFRYELLRVWDTAKPRVLFIGLNPSTADENYDDNTIKRCMTFADTWGFGSLGMANLFGFMATKPKKMMAAADPIGPEWDLALFRAIPFASKVIAAWGVGGAYKGRGEQVRKILIEHGVQLYHLGLTGGGFPRHPLFLRGDTKPTLWEAA